MTVRVERTFEIAASPEEVWGFIADPDHRAQSISVVTDYRLLDDDGREAVWTVGLPIPFVDSTVEVRTEDVDRRPPEYVEFVGRSTVLQVTGEHTITPTDSGSEVRNGFVVEGRLPGVERFFRRNLDDELDNLETNMQRHLGVEA
ncbi:polyketide cyclase [Halobacteriales archaeon SW_7_68_16]|nr:MAG: polyketide cyclase [Halobacteriales archaeon SW_7_68_16]